MSAQNNGGAAFPMYGVTGPVQRGMTLRDYFEAHAPFTLDDARGAWNVDPQRQEDFNHAPTYRQLIEHLAMMRSCYADAMLAAAPVAQEGKEVEYDLTTVDCPVCEGKGACDECSGQGKIIVSRRDMAALAPATKPCTMRMSQGDEVVRVEGKGQQDSGQEGKARVVDVSRITSVVKEGYRPAVVVRFDNQKSAQRFLDEFGAIVLADRQQESAQVDAKPEVADDPFLGLKGGAA